MYDHRPEDHSVLIQSPGFGVLWFRAYKEVGSTNHTYAFGYPYQMTYIIS